MKNPHLLPILLVAVSGCGSSTTPPGFATTPGATILTPSVTKVILTSLGGGFGPSPPAGAACDDGKWTYTITLASSRLAAVRCSVQGPFTEAASYVPTSDDIMLTAPQLEMVKAALRAVTVSDITTCGADAPTREFRVESTAGALTYGDDFYACIKQHEHYVKFDALNDVQAVLGTILP